MQADTHASYRVGWREFLPGAKSCVPTLLGLLSYKQWLWLSAISSFFGLLIEKKCDNNIAFITLFFRHKLPVASIVTKVSDKRSGSSRPFWPESGALPFPLAVATYCRIVKPVVLSAPKLVLILTPKFSKLACMILVRGLAPSRRWSFVTLARQNKILKFKNVTALQ